MLKRCEDECGIKNTYVSVFDSSSLEEVEEVEEVGAPICAGVNVDGVVVDVDGVLS